MEWVDIVWIPWKVGESHPKCIGTIYVCSSSGRNGCPNVYVRFYLDVLSLNSVVDKPLVFPYLWLSYAGTNKQSYHRLECSKNCDWYNNGVRHLGTANLFVLLEATPADCSNTLDKRQFTIWLPLFGVKPKINGIAQYDGTSFNVLKQKWYNRRRDANVFSECMNRIRIYTCSRNMNIYII